MDDGRLYTTFHSLDTPWPPLVHVNIVLSRDRAHNLVHMLTRILEVLHANAIHHSAYLCPLSSQQKRFATCSGGRPEALLPPAAAAAAKRGHRLRTLCVAGPIEPPRLMPDPMLIGPVRLEEEDLPSSGRGGGGGGGTDDRDGLGKAASASSSSFSSSSSRTAVGTALPPPPPLAVFPNAVSESEEAQLVQDAEKWLRKKAYEGHHFDRVIANYREVQTPLRKFSSRSRATLHRLIAQAFPGAEIEGGQVGGESGGMGVGGGVATDDGGGSGGVAGGGGQRGGASPPPAVRSCFPYTFWTRGGRLHLSTRRPRRVQRGEYCGAVPLTDVMTLHYEPPSTLPTARGAGDGEETSHPRHDQRHGSGTVSMGVAAAGQCSL